MNLKVKQKNLLVTQAAGASLARFGEIQKNTT
jgi:hypothetical protein